MEAGVLVPFPTLSVPSGCCNLRFQPHFAPLAPRGPRPPRVPHLGLPEVGSPPACPSWALSPSPAEWDRWAGLNRCCLHRACIQDFSVPSAEWLPDGQWTQRFSLWGGGGDLRTAFSTTAAGRYMLLKPGMPGCSLACSGWEGRSLQWLPLGMWEWVVHQIP